MKSKEVVMKGLTKEKKGYLFLILALCLLFSFSNTNIAFATDQEQPDNEKETIITTYQGKECVAGEVLVRFSNNQSGGAIMNMLDSLNSTVEETLPDESLVVTSIPEDESMEDFIAELESISNVEYVQPNYFYRLHRTVNDPGAQTPDPDQWHLDTINAYEAWDITMGSADVTVAVLDTGVVLDHPDLAGKIYMHTDTVDNDDNANDDDGHGTHVSGIIAAATDNGLGVAGIAPDVKLIVADVFGWYHVETNPGVYEDVFGALTSEIIEGIEYATENGADVINMSLGGYYYDLAYETAIDDAVDAGAVVVASAGNDGKDEYDETEGVSTKCYPADFDSCISVIWTNEDDTRNPNSNYGPSKDIAAPGNAILSTYWKNDDPDWEYALLSGTSMAAPVVTGVVALMLSVNPDLTVDEVKDILYSTALDLGDPGRDDEYGHGRVNAQAAVQAAAKSIYTQGDGTSDNPFGISTPKQLNGVRYLPDSHFIMLNDIDMSEATSEGGLFWNDGSGWYMLCPSSNPFLGSFDGNDMEISGLSNLFYYIGKDSESGKTSHVFDLEFSGVIAHTSDGIIENVHGARKIVGTNNGTILNSSTSGSVSGGVSMTGFVHTNNGDIINCVNNTNVNASHTAAGFAVYNSGTISGCYNTADILGGTGSSGFVDLNLGVIENCFNAGYIEDGNGVGGLVERNDSIVRNCYNIGGLCASEPGAIVEVNYGSVEDCYFLDTIENGVGSGDGTVTNVVPLSESEMLDSAFYASFDFDTIWFIDGQENYPYPQLIGNPYVIQENYNEFDGGCGLPARPYKVSTLMQFNSIRDYPGAWFMLMNDIDMTSATREGGELYNDGEGWEPIGDFWLPFSGGLDGNGYNIIGMYINSSDDFHANGTGLFGNLGSSARIRNLGVMEAYVSWNPRTGSVAGCNGGEILNCYSSGIIKGDQAGGIVESNSGSIINCYSIATVCGGEAGGLAASNWGTIRYGYNAGIVSSFNPNPGGISYKNGGNIEHCRYLDINAYGIGTETGTSSDVLPLSESEMHLESSYSSFDFTSVWTMEGEAGYPYPELRSVNQLPIADNTVDFEGGKGYAFSPYQIASLEQFNNIREYCGGFFELTNNINFSAAVQEGGEHYNSGLGWEPIDDFIGGLNGNGFELTGLMINRPDEYDVGLFSKIPSGGPYIRNLTIKEVDIIGGTEVGSIAGYSGAALTDVNSYGSVTSTLNGSATGGLVGENCGSITLCSNSCDVNGFYAGGIAGASYVGIIRCFNTGVIAGDIYGGGIVGNAECDILNCFNIEEVKQSLLHSGFIGFGGIVGHISSGSLISCYNSGFVHQTIDVGFDGGIAGIADLENTSIEHCYYLNSNDEGIGYITKGTGDNTFSKSRDELKQQATFEGFDFADTWEIIEGERFPVLQGLPFIYTNAISLDKDTIEMNTTGTEILVATISPTYSTNKNITWTSSEESIATVDDGLVTAVSSGSTIITVTTEDGGYTDTCIVKVAVPVTGVSLDESSLDLVVGESTILVGTISPSDATIQNIAWTSSNESVALVDGNGNVSAIATGTATITVTTEDGGYTAQCIVYVTQPVTGVSLNSSSLEINVGSTVELIPTVKPEDASNKSVIWSSGNEGVATVVNGTVTAHNVGEAIITVTTNDGGYTATCTVNVVQKVTGVELNMTELVLAEGESDTLSISVLPSDATNKIVTWTSSNTNVATVTNGIVSAVSEGTSVITVTTADGGFTDSCTVTVKSAQIESSVYVVDRQNGYLKGVDVATSVSTLKSNLANNADDIKVYDSAGNEYTGALLRTGMTVRLIINSTVHDELKIVILGDASGDGYISITDYTLARLDILGLMALAGEFKEASDVNGDGVISITDYTLIRLDILALKKIH